MSGNSMGLVDPDLRPLLEMYPTVALTHDNLVQLRQAEAENILPADEEGTEVKVTEVPGFEGGPSVRLRIYRPIEATNSALGCIYHIHGGGFVAGSARQMEFFVRPMARELGCVIVSVDYRLAPEHPHPAPLHDCHAGLAWLFANAASLGIDPDRIGIMGESAGGGLAAALALMVRDRREHRLAFQSLTYPMIDDRTCVRECWPHAGEFIWTQHNNRFGWSALLGKGPGGEDAPKYAAAARAEDLAGLPPTYLDTAGLDLFLEENLVYAKRLMEAGVTAELHVWPGAFHGFELAGDSAVAKRARQSKLAALGRFLEQ